MNNADNTTPNNTESSDSDSNSKIFTKDNLFESLTDLNTGFDVSSIKHFDEVDFRIIMNRCNDNQIQIYGIESFTKDGGFIDCIVQEMYDLDEQNPDYDAWFLRAFDEFSDKMKSIDTEAIYSASYSIK